MLIQSVTAAAILVVSPWASAQSGPAVPFNGNSDHPYADTCIDMEAALEQAPDGSQRSLACADVGCAEPAMAIRLEEDGIAIAKVCASDGDSQESQPAIPYAKREGLGKMVTGYPDGNNYGYTQFVWSCISINGKLCEPSLHGVRSAMG